MDSSQFVSEIKIASTYILSHPMNKIEKILISGILLVLSSLLYSLANFSEAGNKNAVNILSLEFLLVIAIAIGYASSEYAFKIPAYHLLKDIFSPIELQMIWLLLTSVSVLLFQKFYLSKIIPLHSYISCALIVLILIIDMQYK